MDKQVIIILLSVSIVIALVGISTYISKNKKTADSVSLILSEILGIGSNVYEFLEAFNLTPAELKDPETMKLIELTKKGLEFVKKLCVSGVSEESRGKVEIAAMSAVTTICVEEGVELTPAQVQVVRKLIKAAVDTMVKKGEVNA